VLTAWLLIVESRAPSRRIYLVFPLLVVWANVHGSVLFGAGLTMLAGATLAWEQLRTPAALRVRHWLGRAAVLVAGPLVCIFASPYGFSLASYYDRPC
jgi:hypothetical protein